MKRLKIFLASSINEFRDERNQIGNAIRKIQDKLIDEISKEEYLKIVGLIKNSKKIEDFFIVERDCQELIEELKNKKD